MDYNSIALHMHYIVSAICCAILGFGFLFLSVRMFKKRVTKAYSAVLFFAFCAMTASLIVHNDTAYAYIMFITLGVTCFVTFAALLAEALSYSIKTSATFVRVAEQQDYTRFGKRISRFLKFGFESEQLGRTVFEYSEDRVSKRVIKKYEKGQKYTIWRNKANDTVFRVNRFKKVIISLPLIPIGILLIMVPFFAFPIFI
ncbi:MAG: hypothetical protein IJV29_04215 [Butyrivibrio sp.]|nr:hypothetical protein [Butyrivibrio sp.]